MVAPFNPGIAEKMSAYYEQAGEPEVGLPTLKLGQSFFYFQRTLLSAFAVEAGLIVLSAVPFVKF